MSEIIIIVNNPNECKCETWRQDSFFPFIKDCERRPKWYDSVGTRCIRCVCMCMILQRITHNNIFYLPKIYMKIHEARRLRPEQKQRHIHTAAILHFLCPQGNLNVYYIQFLCYDSILSLLLLFSLPSWILIIKKYARIAYRPTFITYLKQND